MADGVLEEMKGDRTRKSCARQYPASAVALLCGCYSPTWHSFGFSMETPAEYDRQLAGHAVVGTRDLQKKCRPENVRDSRRIY
jgi:hypothetical protein